MARLIWIVAYVVYVLLETSCIFFPLEKGEFLRGSVAKSTATENLKFEISKKWGTFGNGWENEWKLSFKKIA